MELWERLAWKELGAEKERLVEESGWARPRPPVLKGRATPEEVARARAGCQSPEGNLQPEVMSGELAEWGPQRRGAQGPPR